MLDASDSDSDYTSAQECDEARMIRCALCDEWGNPEAMHWVRDAAGVSRQVCQACVDGENEHAPQFCPLCSKGNGVRKCQLCWERTAKEVA